ncbi:metalloregulator ArsR/SmtB family transcription factor [Agaribacterium haliotis]|uniref:metalloregulator ArsR/SmtB family transcription factor n=1 Tax=Agaribacterium haliotis TaxID=2013869 RepID=UPI0023D8AF45|nr:metalloregulator ArsR/SmtB family transcription factor [Agaribacterium haliotis]
MNPSLFFKQLADDTRLRCLLLIDAEGELCVCELMQALNESQPKISRHLAQLRESALLQDRREGQWVFYRLNKKLPAWQRSLISTTRENSRVYMAQARQALMQMGNRPVRKRQCCED